MDSEEKRIRKSERERVRRRMLAYLDSLITSRSDEYGAGWNSALEFVRNGVQRRGRRRGHR